MYQLASQLTRPYTVLVLALLVAAAWQWRRQATATWMRLVVTLLAIGFYLVSCPVVGAGALYSLERYAPPAKVRPKPGDAIIVLSGGIVAEPGGYRLGTDALYRCVAALSLYRQAEGCQLIVSGGKATGQADAPTLATVMRDFFIEQGVKPADIVLEDQSRSTHQNALFTARLVDERSDRTIFLVTDAAHMARARACFIAQGLDVTAYPCYYRASRFAWNLDAFVPSARAPQATEAAVHEWLGLIWYSLRGYI